MKAKEMFKKIGYKCVNNLGSPSFPEISYTKEHALEHDRQLFFNNSNSIKMLEIYDGEEENNVIYPNEVKAIHEQMKELGWL